MIRPASEQDLPAIAQIQSASPEASQWNPQDYLALDCQVAIEDGAVAGFIVLRPVADKEWEILNLAVGPDHRRRGFARRLLSAALAHRIGEFFLEVRESNLPARALYESLGFKVVTKRLRYYPDSGEAAIVMKIHS